MEIFVLIIIILSIYILFKILKFKKIEKQIDKFESNFNLKELELNLKGLSYEKLIVCPQCGGNLRIANGRYGEFLGCSNYPRCKYTRNLRS